LFSWLCPFSFSGAKKMYPTFYYRFLLLLFLLTIDSKGTEKEERRKEKT
jgi:hypothetical protein